MVPVSRTPRPLYRRLGRTGRSPRVTCPALLVLAVLVLPAGLPLFEGFSSLRLAGVFLGGPAPALERDHGHGGPSPLASMHPTNGPGSVLATFDLADHSVLPGNTQPAVQDLPSTVVFDPVNGKLYVRGGQSNAISVVKASTHVLETTVATWISQPTYAVAPTMAVDTATGDLFATSPQGSNVSVIDPGTDRVIRNIPVAGGPEAITFDPASGEIWVANWQGNNVTAISGTTFAVDASVPVGNHPSAILYDAGSNQIFVANYFSDNVTILNATDRRVAVNVAAGTYPIALGLDTVDDYVDVANVNNGAPSNVTVIRASTDTLLGRVGVGSGPQALAFDPAQDWMYIANSASGNVSVLNQSSGKVAPGVTTGLAPYDIVYDASVGRVYVQNSQSENVTVLRASDHRSVATVPLSNGPSYGLAVDTTDAEVYSVSEGSFTGGGTLPFQGANLSAISGSTDRQVASIPLVAYPSGSLYDPATATLLVADPGQDVIDRIDPSSGALLGSVPVGYAPNYLAYDNATGDVWVVNVDSYNISVLGSALTTVGRVGTGFGATAIAYDGADGDVYVPNDLWGNVSVIDGSTDLVVGSVAIAPSANLAAVVYDPHNHDVYVANRGGDNVTVLNGLAKVASVPVGVTPDSLAFDPANDTVFVANSNSANVSVIDDTTQKVVATYSDGAAGFLAYDPAADAVYSTGPAIDEVDATNATTYAAVGGPISLNTAQSPRSITYAADTSDLYVPTQFAGSVSRIGAGSPLSAGYAVSFNETGLPASTLWGVHLNGTLGTGASSSIGFVEANGTYPYTVGAVRGYTPNVTSGSVAVAGAPRTVFVAFTANSTGAGGSYTISFLERGLPQGQRWTVDLGSQSNSSSTPTVDFTEPNGTYGFQVPDSSSYSASPGSGSVHVAGAPTEQNISFAPGGTRLIAGLSVAPTSVVVGQTATFTTTVSGGSPPYRYVYALLPAGCTTSSVASLACVPTAQGRANVTVEVTDANGTTATANTTLLVTAGTSTSSGSSTVTILLLILLILIVIAVLIAILRSRRRGPPPPVPPTSSPTSAPPTAPPPPSAPK